MSPAQQFQNKRTGAVHRLVMTKIVGRPPITVYVLENGECWDKKQFEKDFTEFYGREAEEAELERIREWTGWHDS